ncbi:hypothetical protein ASD50_03680 [Mesorhizobium sp. Root552]|uniref:hypothetical protein n=1 Tax=Mesorhizobium sp. Root552 TaxID=1736555 RepID=UPI000701203C|nr:hypothetical protein [Mesorhizobium sp. Root552]KQZ26519.1 hypothetical protein ASD50_03680 [Mesorhizobium sp. Root552]
MTRSLENHTIIWRGFSIEVRYEQNWLGTEGPFSTAHLQVNTVEPENAPLPITETGYRSRFIDAETIAEAGGPVAFVKAWLDQAAEAKSWKEQQEKARQMTLF